MELIASPQPVLGGGIFTVKDVSFILNLPPKDVRRVLNEYWDGRFSETSQESYSWGKGKNRAVNFYSLIEFKTFFDLRKHGLSAQKISNAHKVLSKYFNTPYPFASSTLKTDGFSLMFEENDALISADVKLQSKIKEAIEPFCKTIDYGTDMMAQRIFPKGRGIDVVVDPHHQMGQPTIKDTNILAESIYKMYKANEKPEFIAGLYELDIKEVNDAIFFYQDVA